MLMPFCYKLAISSAATSPTLTMHPIMLKYSKCRYYFYAFSSTKLNENSFCENKRKNYQCQKLHPQKLTLQHEERAFYLTYG